VGERAHAVRRIIGIMMCAAGVAAKGLAARTAASGPPRRKSVDGSSPRCPRQAPVEQPIIDGDSPRSIPLSSPLNNQRVDHEQAFFKTECDLMEAWKLDDVMDERSADCEGFELRPSPQCSANGHSPALKIEELDDVPNCAVVECTRSAATIVRFDDTAVERDEAMAKTKDSQENDQEFLNRFKERDSSVSQILKEREQRSRKPVLWTQSNRFATGVGVVIIFNAVCLGAEADLGRTYPVVFLALEHVFAALFLIELLLHFWVEGIREYFRDKGNWLDFCLVVMTAADIWVIAQVGIDADVKVVSLMRLIRLARLARLLRLVRIFKELTMIIEGFVRGARSLAWATGFLLIMVYIFAIFARLQIGASYRCADGGHLQNEGDSCPAGGEPEFVYLFNEEIGDQDKLFGSIMRTTLTLFVCLTEGCGIDVVHPTVRHTPFLAIFWLLFLLVTTFGVLNLIIGLFCENSMRIALETERDIVRTQDEVRREKLECLKRAFVRMDKDGTGDITKDEFAEAIQNNDDVIDNLMALGLAEEKDLFDAIDADRSGTLEFNEFFEGVTLIMKGQEPALAKDMVATFLRVNALGKSHSRLEKDLGRLRDQQQDQRQALARIEQRLEQVLKPRPIRHSTEC
jgi:voltage-gated sodium channel